MIKVYKVLKVLKVSKVHKELKVFRVPLVPKVSKVQRVLKELWVMASVVEMTHSCNVAQGRDAKGTASAVCFVRAVTSCSITSPEAAHEVRQGVIIEFGI